jgi:hypothetical protein
VREAMECLWNPSLLQLKQACRVADELSWDTFLAACAIPGCGTRMKKALSALRKSSYLIPVIIREGQCESVAERTFGYGLIRFLPLAGASLRRFVGNFAEDQLDIHAELLVFGVL